MRLWASLIVLALLQLACVMSALEVPTATPSPTVPAASPTAPAPTVTPSPVPTEAESETAIVRQYSVNVHTEPDVKSEVTGYVYADDVVTILECQKDGDYCKIEQPFGWVYRGCLAGFEAGRGCEALR